MARQQVPDVASPAPPISGSIAEGQVFHQLTMEEPCTHFSLTLNIFGQLMSGANSLFLHQRAQYSTEALDFIPLVLFHELVESYSD